MSRSKDIKKELEERLQVTLEWYRNCDICEETLNNVRKDVKSLFEEICLKYKLKDLPFILTVLIEDGFIVVRALDKRVN